MIKLFQLRSFLTPLTPTYTLQYQAYTYRVISSPCIIQPFPFTIYIFSKTQIIVTQRLLTAKWHFIICAHCCSAPFAPHWILFEKSIECNVAVLFWSRSGLKAFFFRCSFIKQLNTIHSRPTSKRIMRKKSSKNSSKQPSIYKYC